MRIDIIVLKLVFYFAIAIPLKIYEKIKTAFALLGRCLVLLFFFFRFIYSFLIVAGALILQNVLPRSRNPAGSRISDGKKRRSGRIIDTITKVSTEANGEIIIKLQQNDTHTLNDGFFSFVRRTAKNAHNRW